MRLRGAGARVRLLLAFVLLVGNAIISPQPPGDTPASSPQAVAAKSDHHHTSQGSGAAKRRTDKDRHQEHQGKTTKSSQGKDQANRGSSGQLVAQDDNPLDADAISAANADDVAALDCGDLTAIQVGDRTFCTHGEDTHPIDPNAPTTGTVTAGLQSQALCIDDGVSGPRIQLVYVYRNDRPDRLNELLPTFRRLAAEMDGIFD